MKIIVNSSHPIYTVYRGMVRRCYEKTFEPYKNYGGRGIKVCNKWLHNKYAFYEWALNNGWEEGLELDRINVNGDYKPSNCRFVTSKVNCRNKRNSKYITYNDQTYTVAEWSERLNIPYSTLYFNLFVYKKSLHKTFEKIIPPEDRFAWGEEDAKNNFIPNLSNKTPNEIELLTLSDFTNEAEYNYIMAICEKLNNNYSKAAKVLNIDRKTIYNKIAKFKKSV